MLAVLIAQQTVYVWFGNPQEIRHQKYHTYSIVGRGINEYNTNLQKLNAFTHKILLIKIFDFEWWCIDNWYVPRIQLCYPHSNLSLFTIIKWWEIPRGIKIHTSHYSNKVTFEWQKSLKTSATNYQTQQHHRFNKISSSVH